MIDAKKLAFAVRIKRGQDSLRIAAEKAGLDYQVLYRIETEKSTPALDHFAKVCRWLGVPMEYFVETGEEEAQQVAA